MQKYSHVIELLACILNMFFLNIFLRNKVFNFFRNVFNPKNVKISNLNIFYIQNNSVFSKICICITFHYVCPIFSFLRQIISRINSIEFVQLLMLILRIFLYFKWNQKFLNRRSITSS